MIQYNYKTIHIHDHTCNACGIIYITLCAKECDNDLDELCYDCYCEYQRWLERNNK